ncbi:MAG TPA: metal ABC transporter permease [bacterium]|nr:metal ABC transporter permease [bacterium]HOL66953.1 metal ABC transporter permease [bacterium]
MLELIGYDFFQRALVAVVLTGICCGLVGVWILLMKISFITVAISHAALAGGLLALVWHRPVVPVAMIFSVVTAGLLAPLSERGRLHPESSIGVMFATALGVVFLVMGVVPEARTQGLSLLWGSLLTVEKMDLFVLAGTTLVTAGLVLACFKEIQAVIFSRELARASGIAAGVFFFLILFLSGAVVTACLKSIGGLLVFSLILNPAAAAYQITYNLKKMYALSCLLAILSGVAGLVIASLANWPAGACVVLVSSFIFFVALAVCPKKRRGKNYVGEKGLF